MLRYFKIFKSALSAVALTGMLTAGTHCAQTFPNENLVENTLLLLLLDGGVTVSSNSPASGSVGIALNTNVTLTFNRAMDTGTVTFQEADGTCSGSVQISGDSFASCVGGTIAADSAATTFTITPTANLALDRNYSVRVTTDAASEAGQKLTTQFQYSFRTGTSIAINPTTLTVPISNGFNFTASGGQTPYTYSVVTSGGGTINSVTGAYTAPGAVASNITIRVTDGDGVTSDSTVTVHTYSSVVQADSALVARYRLNETTLPTAFDSSASGNHGTFNGAVTTTTGALTADTDAALSFNGTTQWIDGIAAPFDPVGTDFSAELWFNVASLVKNQPMVLLGQTGVGGQAWFLIDTTNTDLLASNLGNTGTGVGIPSVNQWNHLVLTKSGTTLRIYLNGALAATNIVTVESAAGPINIGGFGGGNLFNGSIDEVSLYTRALSAADISLRYRLGKNKYLHLTPDSTELRWNVNQQLTPLGGTAPYTYALTSGPGSVDASTGIYSSGGANGTAVVQVTDARGNTDSVNIGVAFSPLNLGNLRLWMRGDAIRNALDGAAIGFWNDMSGFGIGFTHTVSATQPTWNASGLNGHPTLSFDGMAWLTTFSQALLHAGDATIIVVARPQGGVNNRAIFGRGKLGENMADNVLYQLRTNGAGNLQWFQEFGAGTDQFTTSTSTVTVGNWQYIGGVRDATADTVNFLLDGTTGSVGYANDADGGGDNLQRAFIGYDPTATIFQGDIAEILVFNSALVNPNLNNVCNYLNTRYNLSVTCP